MSADMPFGPWLRLGQDEDRQRYESLDLGLAERERPCLYSRRMVAPEWTYIQTYSRMPNRGRYQSWVVEFLSLPPDWLRNGESTGSTTLQRCLDVSLCILSHCHPPSPCDATEGPSKQSPWLRSRSPCRLLFVQRCDIQSKWRVPAWPCHVPAPSRTREERGSPAMVRPTFRAKQLFPSSSLFIPQVFGLALRGCANDGS